MKNRSSAFCAGLFFLAATVCHAQLVTNTFHFGDLSISIPDNNLSGASNTQTISLPFDEIVKVSVAITITGSGSGAFNGDYYVYLTKGDNLAVLLNRPGRTDSDPAGHGDNGFLNVRFEDDAANGDVHVYRETLFGNHTTPIQPAPSPLTGTWAPDGRETFPTMTLDTDPRTALLNVFDGVNPNGEWTLFMADLEGGGTGMLDSWMLEIVTVPEPGSLALLALGGLWFLARRRFRRS